MRVAVNQNAVLLSDKCGWITYGDENAETALDLESWKKRFSEKMRTVR
jgi:hypothetical protein